MRPAVEALIAKAVAAATQAGELNLAYTPECAVERPRDPAHGDWASTIALKLAKELKRSPRQIAEVIAAHIATSEMIAAVEVAGPGFINLRLSPQALQQVVREAYEQGEDFGRANVGQGRRLNIEFISANPTGPMHVGHGRWAALGNALANVCAHAGWQVTREFYVNDAGHQMDVFGQSVALRYRELCGERIEEPEEFYGGAYVTDIARRILEEGVHDAADVAFFRERGYQLMLAHMREVCARAGVVFDVWFSERSLYRGDEGATGDGAGGDGADGAVTAGVSDAAAAAVSGAPAAAAAVSGAPVAAADAAVNAPAPGAADAAVNAPAPAAAAPATSAVQRMLAKLEAGGYLYQSEGATWFRSTDFGDDKDRVLVKSDGSYTYFAPDIAYHLDKFERTAGALGAGSPAGSEFLINIWGADHHGYIPRMQAAVTALGHGGKLTVVLGQLVNLYRDGEAVRMSKRSGEMVTFEELLEEVGPDATKYLMLTRSSDQPIDFDIEAAKKQDAGNPVYYVQYAHARICSLLRKAAGGEEHKGEGEHKGDVPFCVRGSVRLLPCGHQGHKRVRPLCAHPPLCAPTDSPLADLSLLVEDPEFDLARELARLSEVVEAAARDLAPFRLTHYAQELATAFHAFYTHCPVLSAEPELAAARLYLAEATRKVLALTLSLLGVSAPERM